jgi:hypothetical protein
MERTNHDRTITCREIPNSRTVRSFIEKRLGEWIRVHGYDDRSAHYHVTLDREGGGHLVFCQIEVVTYSGNEQAPKTELWTGSWSALGLHQALLKTLNHMMPKPAQHLRLQPAMA